VKKYLAIVKKEYLQVVRDLPGLAILFLMPALMLIVIALTQEKVIIGRESGMRIILVNADSSAFGNSIGNEMKANLRFDLVAYASEKEAEKDVFNGKFQLMVVIPDSSTERLVASARRQSCDITGISTEGDEKQSAVILLYDPAVMEIYKDMLASSLHMIIESTAMKIFMETYKESIKSDIAEQFAAYRKELLSVDVISEMPDFPYKKQVLQQFKSGIEKRRGETIQIKLPQDNKSCKSLVTIKETSAGNKIYNLKPDIVKNNVPAFILFAMFFIVIPLAGSIINEKQQGTKDRLMTLPVSGFTFLSGKITVYLLVCILQFMLMVGIGIYIFPRISQLPPLSLDVNPGALWAVVIASGLAAIGFGMLIGTVSTTYGQAAPLGSVMVVVLAILGGIFVPSFMMPDLIRKISIISPLRWGTDAFFSIFARGAGIKVVLPQLISLLIFFGIAMLVSMRVYTKRK